MDNKPLPPASADMPASPDAAKPTPSPLVMPLSSVPPAAPAASEGVSLGVPKSLSIAVGSAMPSDTGRKLPRLNPTLQVAPDVPLDNPGPTVCRIAEGMDFTGNAELRGPCSISGRVVGNLKNAPGTLVAVVVTETGRLKGDLVANKISVMGQTDGTLDAAGGMVSLHDGSSVSGHVRYSRIQVNGADLNATLERVAEVPARRDSAAASSKPTTP